MSNKTVKPLFFLNGRGRKLAISFLLSTILFLSIVLQFRPTAATNQIIFFTNVELSTLGPISESSAADESVYPAGLNDEMKQEDVRVAGLANGTLLLGWDIEIEAFPSSVPADERDLFGKIYNADGTTITSDIQLYDYDSIGHANDVALTPTSDGGFYAVWFRDKQIAARKFNSSGVATGPAQTILTDTVGTNEPEMVELTNGNFMLTYRQSVEFGHYEVGSRLYDSTLTPVTSIMSSNEVSVTFVIKPNVAPLRNGGSIISWPGRNNSGDTHVFAQLFDASGAKVGPNKQVSASPVPNQESAQIAPFLSGNSVVVYQTSSSDIAGRLLNQLGEPLIDEFIVNKVQLSGFQHRPDVVGLKDGSFVVTWESFGGEEGPAGSGSAAILAVQLDQTGTALSEEFVVNQSKAGAQEWPYVSAIDGTIPVVVWEGIEQIDTSMDGVNSNDKDAFMRILNREPMTTTAYSIGVTDTLTNEQVTLVGSEEILTVTVQISANYDQGFDSLNAAVTGTISSNFDAPSGTLTLSGSNVTADYAAVIKTISFQTSTSADPAPPRTVTWSIFGASGLLDTADIEIVINQAAATATPVVSTETATPIASATATPAATETSIPTGTATSVPTVTSTATGTLTATPIVTGTQTATPDAPTLPPPASTSTTTPIPSATLTPSGTAESSSVLIYLPLVVR
ncbi:MAG: hypothetical protein AB8G95_19030 [Anaerolineae bacterium]